MNLCPVHLVGKHEAMFLLAKPAIDTRCGGFDVFPRARTFVRAALCWEMVLLLVDLSYCMPPRKLVLPKEAVGHPRVTDRMVLQ